MMRFHFSQLWRFFRAGGGLVGRGVVVARVGTEEQVEKGAIFWFTLKLTVPKGAGTR